jgi:hypothetical protein
MYQCRFLSALQFVRLRARLRIDESLGEARALSAEVKAWRARWDTIDAMGGHLTHLDLLTSTVRGMIDEIEARTAAIDPAQETGETYERCRENDRRLLHARRLWRWYADKLDQRASSADETQSKTLMAADEIVWSCWKTAFTTLTTTLPSAPIPYLAPLFSATATPRSDPPEGLRPGKDDLLRRHVEQLPIPVVALPPICGRRPWWLILTAHESSHHVEFEAHDLEQRIQEIVVNAAYDASKDTVVAEKWLPWCRELFADLCSTLLVGPAAIWAVAELETRPGSQMRKSPSITYPPPLIRLAFLNAVAEQAGLPTGPKAYASNQQDDDETLRQLHACVPAVATAMLNLSPADGRTLRDLSAQAVEACSQDGSIDGWRAELLSAEEPVPRQTLYAARFCAAAGVGAWQQITAQANGNGDKADDGKANDARERLARRMLTVIPQCREPGTRAIQAAAAPNAKAITRRFVSDLYGPEGATLE